MAEYTDTAEFRGARFCHVDLSGATFRECDLRGVTIVASAVDDLRVDGYDGVVGRVTVNDVDVTAYVEAQLDERYPERVQLRAAQTLEEYRAMWETVEGRWGDTVLHARRLPADVVHQRVGDEWSLVETLRHLVFAIDVWVGRMVRQQELPYHPWGLPPTDAPSERLTEIGLDVQARPSFEEVVSVHAERMAQMRELVATVSESELDQQRTAAPAPWWDPESETVERCLRVVMREHIEHRRFAERDLAAIAAR